MDWQADMRPSRCRRCGKLAFNGQLCPDCHNEVLAKMQWVWIPITLAITALIIFWVCSR